MDTSGMQFTADMMIGFGQFSAMLILIEHYLIGGLILLGVLFAIKVVKAARN